MRTAITDFRETATDQDQLSIFLPFPVVKNFN